MDRKASQDSTAERSVRWGDRVTEELAEAEWYKVQTKKAERNRFISSNLTVNQSDNKAKVKKSVQSYMSKVDSKKNKAEQFNFNHKNQAPELRKYFEYASKKFSVLAVLSTPTNMEKEILMMMKEGKFLPPVLPEFLKQIMTSRNIARFNAFLTKQYTAELFTVLAPGQKIPADLPSHAIMRNICTAGEVPTTISDNITAFKKDVADVYFLAQKRILIFSFNSNEKAEFWSGKELPFQNKPLTLNYYYNAEAHQRLPPVYADNRVLMQGKSTVEKLQLLESIKTKIRYRLAIVNASALLKLHHIETLLVDTLHLKLGSISHSINPITGIIRKSTWDIELLTEGCPSVLVNKTSIQWGHHKIMVFHHTIKTSLPCTKCYAATHIYAKCKVTDEKQKHQDNVLRLRQDKDYQRPAEAFLLHAIKDFSWNNLINNEEDHAFIAKIQNEAALDEYRLAKDIDILYVHRLNQKKLKQKQKHKKMQKQKGARRILQRKEEGALATSKVAQYDQFVTESVKKVLEYSEPNQDPFSVYALMDNKLPDKCVRMPDRSIWTENATMAKNDSNLVDRRNLRCDLQPVKRDQSQSTSVSQQESGSGERIQNYFQFSKSGTYNNK